MRKVKWTSKGRNIWSINRYNKSQPHGFHVVVLELSVRNKATDFVLSIRREFDTSVKIPNFLKEEQAMKVEVQGHEDYIHTGKDDL